MNFKVIYGFEEINRDKWTSFIRDHPHGNVFQSPDMYEFYSLCKNYEPVVVAVVNDISAIRGILLAVVQRESSNFTGFFTARTVIWGGPLISTDNQRNDENILNLVLNALVESVKPKSIYIQFRNLFDLDGYKDIFKQFSFNYLEHINFQVDTASSAEIKKAMSSSKMRQIKKSIAAGAEIIEPSGIDQVKVFYTILKELYRKRVKRPLPDWLFFEQFYLASLNDLLGKYFLIKYNNEIVGGIMCPITAGKAIYEWYVGGLDGKYDGVYPSVLATWAPIDYALKNGLQNFDFMGAGKPEADYGVREFKSKFGGKVVSYGRYERINHRMFYQLGKLGISLLKKL